MDENNNYFDIRFCGNYTKEELYSKCNEIFSLCRKTGFIFNKHSKLLRYHPSIFHSHLEGLKSPYEAFYDDNLLMKAIYNCSKYMPQYLFLDNNEMIVNKIIQRFTIKKIAPHSTYLKTNMAKQILKEFGELDRYKKVIDPFSGFSGKMLASYDLGLQYEGYDINDILVYESNNMIKQENLKYCSIKQEDLFNAKAHKSDILITCPPYKNKESWIGTDSKNLTCDQWINEVFKKYDCKIYLFIVDNTEEYQHNILKIKRANGFIGSSNELILKFY